MKPWNKFSIAIVVMSLLFISPAYAGFKYGVDTYEKVDDILIVNSLGDQVTPSTFGKLGVNDFIPENGVKNYLALEGYTQANDYNPTVTNPQFASYYGEKPGEEYVKLTFAGLEGDPRKTQDVWVLEKEYYKYSSQSQDERINSEVSNRISSDNSLQNNINVETQQRKNADANLQDSINVVDASQTNWNEKQDNSINSINKVNDTQDQQINDLDSRVNSLEKTQTILGGEIRVLDTKKWEIKVFADYSTERNMVDRTGVRFTYKFGESYEEKRINQLERQINTLIKLQEENSVEVIPTSNGFKINSQF